MQDKKIILHLVSDSTGETLQLLSKAVMSQFDDIEVREYIWSLTKNKEAVEKISTTIKSKPGIVLYTIAEQELKDYFKNICEENNILCIEALEYITNIISKHIGKDPNPTIGKQHIIDQSYFKRIEAMNFTITHDDGQTSDNIKNAEIVILGPSRTSKSPTSMYLAFRGFKTANIPLVKNIPIDESIFDNKNIFFVGLTISPKRLVEIRKNRLLALKERRETDYTDFDQVKEDVISAKKLCTKYSIPMIDVTRRSVEETSAIIVQMYYENRKKTSNICLIGSNIRNSLSPIIYNEWFKKYNIPAFYFLEEIPENKFEEKFPLVLKKYEAINVTSPYKKKVGKFLGDVKTQSINCIYKNEGYSTDLYGFIEALKELHILREFNNSKSVLVLGSGAMASMIVDYLKGNKNENIELFTRDKANSFDFSKEFEFVVNATTVKGIYQNNLKRKHYLDLNYKKEVEESFAKYMLIYQAKKCFDIWFGIDPEISQKQMRLLNL